MGMGLDLFRRHIIRNSVMLNRAVGELRQRDVVDRTSLKSLLRRLIDFQIYLHALEDNSGLIIMQAILVVTLFSHFFTNILALDGKYIAAFFSVKNVRFATVFICDLSEQIKSAKELNEVGIRNNFPIMDNVKTLSNLTSVLYYPSSQMTAVAIDMKCNNSRKILQIASENRFLDISRHWLIFTEHFFTFNEFENISLELEPDLFDVDEYLEFGNSEMLRGPRIREFNAQVNKKILDDPDVITKIAKSQKTAPSTLKKANVSWLALYANLKAIVDSEVTLAVGSEMDSEYDLYQIHRKTLFSKMECENIGKMAEINGNVDVKILVPSTTSAVLRRKNFNGAIMRATSALLSFDYFSKEGELTTQLIDYYSVKHLQTSKLVEEQLNFRMLVKCFDDYGWYINGSYTGMLRHLYEQKADMTSGGMLLYTSRMDAISFIDNMWKARIGLVFKEPPLSQVANIFILPFSASVWLSTIALFIASAVILYFQFRKIEKIAKEPTNINFLEVFTFLTGAAFQQGTELTTNVLSARITMFVFLVAALFVFTSYTANIVALLQSSSNAINDVRSFIDSPLELLFEDLPYEEKLIEDDTSLLIRELYRKKLYQKKLEGTAYVNASYGMERVRNGMFALHVQLPSSAKIIGETFDESEKCRIKALPIFPFTFNGHGVPKRSPYWEILAQGFRWCVEVGFTARADKRYGYEMPKCSGKSEGGYSSIGLGDVHNLLVLLANGIAISVLILIAEKIHYFLSKQGETTLGNVKKLRKKRGTKSAVSKKHNVFYTP